MEALGRLAAPPETVGVSAWHRNPPEEPFIPSVPVAQLRLPRAALYRCWHKMRWPSVQRATGPVDAIHATGMAVPPRTAPLAVTVNDLAFLRHPDHFTARGVRFFAQSLELARNDADIVVCPSQHTADDCLHAGIAAEKVRIVPYWVDDCLTPPQEAEGVRQRFGLAEKFVLWVGTAEPRKNLSGLLEAWQTLDRSAEQLVLVGPAGWNSNPNSGEFASNSGLDGASAAHGQSVRRLGFLSEADKRALMRAAAMVCYPSLTEGFGLPVLEAMVQETPVVTSATGATAEVAGRAGVLVDPLQPRAIADALAGLLDSPEEAARLGQQGRERAQAEFTWQRTAQGLLDVYQEIVD